MSPKPTVALNDPDISNMLGRKCSASPLVFWLTEPLACEIFMLAREAVARRRWQGGQQVFFFFLLDSAAEVIVREGGRGRPSGFAAAGPMGHHQGAAAGSPGLAFRGAGPFAGKTAGTQIYSSTVGKRSRAHGLSRRI